MKEPYKQLLKCVHMDLANSSLMALNLNIFEMLKHFTSNELLADVFMDYIQPENPNLGIEYANTLLGSYFCLSVLPKTMMRSYEFYQTPLDHVRTILNKIYLTKL